jgi:hypothetical protein
MEPVTAHHDETTTFLGNFVIYRAIIICLSIGRAYAQSVPEATAPYLLFLFIGTEADHQLSRYRSLKNNSHP